MRGDVSPRHSLPWLTLWQGNLATLLTFGDGLFQESQVIPGSGQGKLEIICVESHSGLRPAF